MPTMINIWLFAEENEDGTIGYSLAQSPSDQHQRLKPNPTGPNGPPIIWSEPHEQLDVKFHLKGVRRLKFRDPQPISVVLASAHQSGCPAPANHDCRFVYSNVQNRVFDLLMPNPGPTQTDYFYGLFIWDGTTDYPYDPVIENGGGQGFEQPWISSIVTGLIGLAAGIGLTYLAALMGWIHFGR